MNEVGSTISSRINPDYEPQGRPVNLIWLGAAGLLFLQFMVYLVRDGHFMLLGPLMATLFAILGIAESLPPSRQRMAYKLRILGIAMAILVLVLSMVDLFGGPRLLF